MAVLPWTIIGGLLWAGLFIKPKPVGSPITPPVLEQRDNFYGLAAAPDGSLWAAGSRGKIVAFHRGGEIRQLTTPVEKHLQDIAIWDANHALAVGNDGEIIYSRDGGASWVRAAAVPRSEIANKFNRVRVAPGGIALVTGEMGALLMSRDYGQSWSRLREEEDVAWNDVVSLDEEQLVVVGEFGRILRSSDGGLNWREIPSPTGNSLMAVSFRDSQHGVAVGVEGVALVTADGGDSWQTVATGASDHLFDVLWLANEQQWFATGALGRWLRADAGGRQWRVGKLDDRDPAWHTRVLPTDDGLWLAGANIGLWDGQRWSPLQARAVSSASVSEVSP